MFQTWSRLRTFADQLRESAGAVRMHRPHLDDLPELPPPFPYRIRRYRTGDDAEWANLMNHGLGHGWNERRFWERFGRDERFGLDGLVFAEHGQDVVGTAAAARATAEDATTGILECVVVAPGHRGHRLGLRLSAAVLGYLRQRGLTSAVLETTGFRLAAIKTYLNLGFEPVCQTIDDARRWQRIYRRIALAGRGDKKTTLEL